MYELIIIGGGPAGIAAGVYASRKQLKTLFVTKDWGGQSTVSAEIQNWIGTPTLSGQTLAENCKAHLLSYADGYLEVVEKVLATSVAPRSGGFLLTLDNDVVYETQTLLIASGSRRRQLSAHGADTFEHKGLTYCASCDGPLFAGQDVAVIGGGNAGFETAAQLLAYAKSVTLIQHSATYKADPVTVQKVLAHPNMRSLTNALTTEVFGNKFVEGLRYRNESGDTITLPVSGIFVEIGMLPNTDFVKDVVTLDEYGRITIDPWTQKTGTPGIWAAGDCTNVRYHQNNISAGDGVRALEDIYVTLRAR
jgi:alkyl hydroperoxide reductase subunit F